MSEETEKQETALVPVTGAVQRDFRAGTAALAEMPQAEFDARLASMARGRDRLRQIHCELMTAETDYGVIPGTQKPTLLKPGAEKLLHFYRLCSEFIPTITRGDGESEPWITVVTECRLHIGDLEGPVVNTGHGAANSWERKYRRGNQDSPAAHDLLNTLVKMSIKRAMVDATLRATATSGVYSQDMEDLVDRPPAPAPKVAAKVREDPPQEVLCEAADCGQFLTEDEVLGCVRHAAKLHGHFYCTEHGRQIAAANKAAQEPAAE